MPPKKRTKGKPKSGDNSKRKRKKSFTSSDDYESDTGAKGDNPFKDNNHNNNQHLDEDNGVSAEDQALMPTLPALAGRLIVSGGTNWDLIGRKELPKAVKNSPQINSGLTLPLIWRLYPINNVFLVLNYR